MAAAAASSQRRSVFVGNIPYDASEDQLIQICQEAGPVVSFRLMLDRETGKTKGYGFCEYKDEETALSARRNLQGYEINGRQLRIDFAANDKGSDRGREQDRGGPGLISNNSNNDAQKPLPGPLVHGDSSLHQPMGLPLASSAASVMDEALGGSSLQSLTGLGKDPLTIHLSKISRHQLNNIMNEMKVLATQNKPLVHQLLQGSPQFSKALFQAQIMMGLVSPQMLQMANERQSSDSVPQPSLKDNTANQKTILPSFPGQIASQKEALAPNLLTNLMPLEQSAPPFHHVPMRPPLQHLFPPQCQGLPQGMMSGQSGVPTLQPRTSLVSPTSLIPHIQPLLLPHPRPGNVNSGHQPHLSVPSTSLQQSLLSRPPSQMCSTSHSVLHGLETHTKNAESSNYVGQNSTGPSRLGKHPNGLAEQRGSTDLPELINNPLKRQRLENGASAPKVINGASAPQVISNNPVSGESIAAGSLSASQQTIADPVPQAEKLMPQFPPDIESALLQQVLSLTPEQLSSLPLDQQQQVFQLQQMIL